MPQLTPILKSAPCVKKHPVPLIRSSDLPYESALVFNAGVTKFNGKYIMIFRNDYGTSEERFLEDRCFSGTNLGVAISDNGVDNWEIRKNWLIDSHELSAATNRELRRFYDPRITVIEGKPYLCLATDTRHGIRGCIAAIDDNFEKIEPLSLSVPNNRNMVLFPERIGGKYIRLERPMADFGEHCCNYDVWMTDSADLVYWGNPKVVIDIRQVPFANEKIGPAAPPIKTEKGWLTTFHAVDYDPERGKNGWAEKWEYRYSSGIMLLDLEDPSKVLGVCKTPLMAPELDFETDIGFRQNTIFPGGMILEPDGEVKMYYGASDTVECLATANVDDLIKLCLED